MARVRGRVGKEVYANLPALGNLEQYFALGTLQMTVTKDVHRHGGAEFGSGPFWGDCER
jgi:hypothetical protein